MLLLTMSTSTSADDEVVLVADDDDGVKEDGTATSSGLHLQPQSTMRPEVDESDNYVLPNVKRPSARPCVQAASIYGVCHSVAGPLWLAHTPGRQRESCCSTPFNCEHQQCSENFTFRVSSESDDSKGAIAEPRCCCTSTRNCCSQVPAGMAAFSP
jgi:hypothetical protein